MFAVQQGHQSVEDGDTVILYAGKFRITHLAIKRGERLINRFGAFKHDDIIGWFSYGTGLEFITNFFTIFLHDKRETIRE